MLVTCPARAAPTWSWGPPMSGGGGSASGRCCPAARWALPTLLPRGFRARPRFPDMALDPELLSPDVCSPGAWAHPLALLGSSEDTPESLPALSQAQPSLILRPQMAALPLGQVSVAHTARGPGSAHRPRRPHSVALGHAREFIGTLAARWLTLAQEAD